MATVEKTYLYSERFKEIKYKKLGKTGFQSSICGFGTYRVDYRVKEHNEAMEYALLHGINLIDTAANYSDGGSEILGGSVITKLIEEGVIERDEIIVVTKGGYMQGENLAIARQKEYDGAPYSEVVKCAPDLWHCIHPDFLADQITQSLKRMELDSIDIYLLHNPEYFLSYTNIQDMGQLKKEYYRRICEAFIHLEAEVVKGRIKYYGVSSNTFAESVERWNHTSLEKLIEISEQIMPDNHFAVVQLPLNILEKEGAKNRSGIPGGKSFLETAYKEGLGVLVNRPLNAIEKNKIIRLADFPVKEDRTMEEVNVLIDNLQRLEENIMKDYVDRLEIIKNDKDNIAESLSLSVILKSTIDKFQSANQFVEIKKQYFVPRANFAVNEIYSHYPEENKLVDMLNYYATTVNILLDSIESIYAKQANNANKKYHDLLAPYLPETAASLTLSQKVLLMINSLPEASTTLVGMRSVEYVVDVMGSIQVPYVENIKQFWDE